MYYYYTLGDLCYKLSIKKWDIYLIIQLIFITYVRISLAYIAT